MKCTDSPLTSPQWGHESSSGSSWRIDFGFITPPESWCAPATLPFSITATGTSPSFSVSSGSSSRSSSSRIAHAIPAWPPPTIATPTSMRSSSASVGGPMNSFAESTGGGNWLGATLILLAALLGLHGLGQLGHDLVEVADDPEVGELEDRGVGVLVDRHDVLRGLHPDLVLDRAGDAGGEIQLGRHGLARLADLGGVGVPARVDHRAGGRHGAAHRTGQLLERLEALGLAEPAAAGHEDVGVLDVHVGAALLAALDHRGPEAVRGELDLHVLHRGVAGPVPGRLEGVQAADDDPHARVVVHVGDLRVAQDRPLGDELAVLHADVGDLHADAGVQARGQAGADLEAEQAAAEQRVAEAVVRDDLRHRVDDGLRQALGALDAVDLGGAVGPERRAELVGQAGLVADHDDVALGVQLGGEAGALGDGAERVLVEGALVVERVDQDPAHASSFLSSSHATICSTVSLVSSSSMIRPDSFCGGALKSVQRARAFSWPTRSASMPTSAAALVSSGFFLAPMIAFSDG